MTSPAATILIVDDDIDLRALLETLLRSQGYLTLSAANGEEALASIAQRAPDLILLDILMPGMDGNEVARRLKANPATANIPIIIVTVQLDRSARLAGLNAGAEDFLTKPIDRDELWLRVRNLLRLKELGDFHRNHSSILEQEVQARTTDLKRFRAAMAVSPDSIYLTDPVTMRFVYLNDTACQRLGYARERLLQMGPQDVLTAGREQVSREYDDVIAAGDEGLIHERPFVRNDGTKGWTELHRRALLTDDGTLIVTIGRDITERKRAESELRETQERYRRLVEVSPDAIYVVQNDEIVFANTAALQLFGASTSTELLGRSVLELTHPDFRATSISRLRALESGSIVNPRIEQVFLRLDGTPVDVEVASVRFSEHDAVAVQVVARDITERKKSDEDLRRFRAAMEASGDAILLIDRTSMRYIDVNQTLCDLVGRTRQELIGMTPMDLFSADRETLERDYDAIIADKNSSASKIEGQYRHKDGSLIPIETRRRALHAGDGWIIVGTARDITERKRADEKIRRLNRVYAVLSGINSAIVRTRERGELFKEACRIAVSEGEFVVARVIALDENGKAHIAATTELESSTFLEVLDEFNRDPDISQSLLAQALRTGQPVVSNDLANDPRVHNRAALTKEGTYALVLLPLTVEKRVVGCFILRARDAGMFDDEELRLLLEMVSDLAFALDHISKEERLNYLAMYDPLTGLANRTLFLERLNQYIQVASPTGNKVALVLADIERFRTINESLGRQAGDAVIKEFAERFASEVGKAELARIGADQFVIVLQAIKGKSEVARRIERLWQSCFAEPFRVSGVELRISAKAGVTLFPNDGADAELLLRNAEAALVKAKELGERYVFYTSALTERTGERLTLENQLRQALEKNEFVLHYQPKVELEARRIVGVEALIRWQSPELGLVPPMKFIPLMEETGLILDVGAWALDKAIEDHLRWMKLGLPAPRVAVNVSAIQLRRRDFVFIVEDALTRGATPPGVDLEITESLVMEDIESNMQKLKDIRDLGVSIAIDDFGTGYSSLGYLAKLPVQTLKIDRSFIITMLKDSDTMTLVSTIISLAHSLRLKVVAEGVDEEEQAKVLRLLRCDEMQGYLFSRPIPFDQMTALLAQGAKG